MTDSSNDEYIEKILDFYYLLKNMIKLFIQLLNDGAQRRFEEPSGYV